MSALTPTLMADALSADALEVAFAAALVFGFVLAFLASDD